MKKTIIRLLSLLLCLVTLVSLLPMSAEAATTLGAPKNLKWNKSWDWGQGKLVTQYGSVSWQPQKPVVAGDGTTWYEVTLYRNDSKVHTQWVGWSNLGDFDSSQYLTFDCSPFIEKSGTYHVTIRTVADSSKYASSKKVTSGDWTYTKPSTRVAKPTNISWDWPNAVWEGDGPFQIEMYYSPTKVDTIDEMHWFHTQWGIYENANYAPNDLGPGYYRFRIRTMSTNIKTNYHSYWVTSDLYRFRMDTPTVELTQASASSKPKLSWGEVDYAVQYEVYRATSKDGDYSKIKTTTETDYTDKDASRGRTYYYKVRAVTIAGAKSSFCTPIEFIYKLATPTVTAKNVASTGKIKLTWDNVTGAKEYKIYRAVSEDGEYQLMKTTTSTSYTNTSAKAGNRYYYKVKAIGRSSKANSDDSAVVARWCDLARPVAEVSNYLNSGKIKLSWDAVDGAVGYHVYRSTSKDGEYERQITITDGTTYTDTNAHDLDNLDQTYYYRVVATMDLQDENNASNSAKSVVVSRNSKLARPEVAITRTSKGKPSLTWDAVPGAIEYQVYRATSKNGEYSKLKTVTKTSFNNTGAKAGETYYYKVKAVYSNSKANSAFSKVQSIKSK